MIATPKWISLALVLFALGFCHAGSVHGQDRGLQGTYKVWICQEQPCEVADTSRATVSGHLVLGSVLPRSMLPEDVGSYLSDRSIFIRMSNKKDPNACFVLMRQSRITGTMAGIIPVGLTRWVPDVVDADTSDTAFSILLYASPDAFSTFSVQVEGEQLRGTGRSSGFIGEPFDEEGGAMIGWRTGPPDLEVCYQAARAQSR